MDLPHPPSLASVSNLVPVWDDDVARDLDGGGTYHSTELADVAAIVEHAVHADGVVELEQPTAAAPVPHPRAVMHPVAPHPAVAQVASDPAPVVAPAVPAPLARSAFSYDDLLGAEAAGHAYGVLEPVDYDALRRRDIARELLRARLVAAAEQREHRSAYEIVFILLAAAVAVLLSAPPLVQVLLAARGIEA